MPNKEFFEGNLEQDSNKYCLEDGEYKWPSGQIYKGKFNKNNMLRNNYKSILIIEPKQIYIYEGEFKDGKLCGKGEIIWDNGDEKKGFFIKGKINGKTFVKK